MRAVREGSQEEGTFRPEAKDERKLARERTLLWSVDVRGGHPQRHPDASDAAGRGCAKPLFITTNLDVLEKNLQGAAVQKAAGEKKRTSASNQPPALPGGARKGLRGRACCRPLQGPPGG